MLATEYIYNFLNSHSFLTSCEPERVLLSILKLIYCAHMFVFNTDAGTVLNDLDDYNCLLVFVDKLK